MLSKQLWRQVLAIYIERGTPAERQMAELILEMLDLHDESSPGLEQAVGTFFDRKASWLLEMNAA